MGERSITQSKSKDFNQKLSSSIFTSLNAATAKNHAKRHGMQCLCSLYKQWWTTYTLLEKNSECYEEQGMELPLNTKNIFTACSNSEKDQNSFNKACDLCYEFFFYLS